MAKVIGAVVVDISVKPQSLCRTRDNTEVTSFANFNVNNYCSYDFSHFSFILVSNFGIANEANYDFCLTTDFLHIFKKQLF